MPGHSPAASLVTHYPRFPLLPLLRLNRERKISDPHRRLDLWRREPSINQWTMRYKGHRHLVLIRPQRRLHGAVERKGKMSWLEFVVRLVAYAAAK